MLRKGQFSEDEYISALLRDLEIDLTQYHAAISARELTSIFLGGGTPSLFSGSALARLLSSAQQRLAFEPDIEITLEANPGTIEHGQFAEYYQAGINRISLGAQSFDSGHLKQLGRIHDPVSIVKAVNEIKQAGFENFNIDIMHGLPNQTIEQARSDLQQAIDLSPTHISWYQLTIEPNTVFYRQPPRLPNDDLLAEIEQAGKHLLAKNGYVQYEVSAYSKAGYQSKHNLNYWQFGDYLGIGAGAHGKITVAIPDQIIRTCKKRQPSSYLSGNPYALESEAIKPDELILEFMLNALRLTHGFTVEQFESHTGVCIYCIESQLKQGIQQGLLTQQDNRIQPTDKGQQFLNDLLLLFDD